MSKAALVQMLDRWTGSREGDPDASFITRFLTERDEDAFAALVHRHGALVYGTCQRILGNPSDTDDAFQAVFFVLARRAHTLKHDRSIGPWLHGVALRVAKKLRGQIVRRRLREMAAAKSERVEAAEPDHDFWTVIDEEVARLSLSLREVLLLCDLGGRSHAQTAASLGLAKGTVTKRLAKAHEELGTRLKRRGITLGAGALAGAIATRAPAAVPAPLLLETARQAVAFSIGQVSGSVAAKALAEGAMRSLKFRASRVCIVVGLLALALTGGGLMLAGGPNDPGDKQAEPPQARGDAKPEAAKVGTMWRELFSTETDDHLPVSVVFSPDGKWVLTGDVSGEVTALIVPSEAPTYHWRSKVGGSHPALAYSVDQKQVYATTANGVLILDAATGAHVGRIEVPDSNPIAIGVFPKKPIGDNVSHLQIVFGNARGYFVKTWADLGKPTDTMSTLETSTLAKGAQPADLVGVPLAVDPKGRSAIMTGPRDATGEVAGVKGKNVLWAYVCGDHSEGSPGNRVMVGHTATVVAAAWSREGSTAVTGDADGRVIVWDAKTMKESRRVELSGRIMAVAISPDGTHTAASVRARHGSEVYAWETAMPAKGMKPIYTEQGDFGSDPYASLAFSSDGKRLAGCAIDRKWLQFDRKTLPGGKIHVWELAAEPRAQAAPKHLYTEPLPKGSSADFVIENNLTILTFPAKEGALDFRDIRFGYIQGRIVLGKFTLGGIKRSDDRKWLAIEEHPIKEDKGGGGAAETLDVGVYFWPPIHKAHLPSCGQALDIASGGKIVAVVREKQIELWDSVAVKKVKAAPFKPTRIDAARFSPDGKLLAVSDRNELVLWRWEEGTHERIDFGRRVGSLTFSPDGKSLAEGPTPGENIQVRDLETRKVVLTLANAAKRPMNVTRMAYTQGGRVLIACDSMPVEKDTAAAHRINLWDTANGTLAHQIALPAGVPSSIDVTPNGLYLAAIIDTGDPGLKLSVWRLDGKKPATEEVPAPPASGRPR
jgi:RNA polymerase sigma factor (sigma-70 family)